MSSRPEHERIVELLPWFVNGTLDAAERELVEHHVRACLPCRASLDDQRRMQRLIREQPPAPTSVDANFGRLMRRIDREDARTGTRRPGKAVVARPGPLAWLQLGAAVAVIALLAFGIRSVLRPAGEGGPAPYSTASDAAAVGPRIDIVFAESVSEPELRALLLELGGTVVAGPTAIGRYTIELNGRNVDDADLGAIIDKLQRDPRVRLAARSYIAP